MRKKIIYGVCMLGLVALVATSCKKNEENANSFSASFGTLQEVSIDGDDRAYIYSYTVNGKPVHETRWQYGDQIKIFNCENGNAAIFHTETDHPANVAHFFNTGPSIGYASEYYAFYPAEMAKDSLGGDGWDGEYQTFTLDPVQYIYPRGIDGSQYTVSGFSIPQAAKKAYSDPIYKHQIIFGMAWFMVTCDAADEGDGVPRYVEKIEVTDNHFNLHGTVKLRPNKINPDKLQQMMNHLKAGGVNDPDYKQKWNEYVIGELGYSAQGRGRTLVMDYRNNALNDGKGVKLAGFGNNETRLPICLRPGAFAYGFTLTIWVNDGGNMKPIIINKWNGENRNMAAEPGKLKRFNVGDITELVDNYNNPQ